MDFSAVELSAEDKAFQTEVREFLASVVTEDVIRRDRETGDNFDEGVHLALGAAGYLEKEWKTEADGGFSRVRRRIWELEKRRAEVPWVTGLPAPPSRPMLNGRKNVSAPANRVVM